MKSMAVGLGISFAILGCGGPPRPEPVSPPSPVEPQVVGEPPQDEPPRYLAHAFALGGVPIEVRLPTENQATTPVPFYIEPPESLGVTKVVIHFRAFGAERWTALDMKPFGQGFGVLVPCFEVTTTGDLKYWIDAIGSWDLRIGTIGSAAWPLRVAIKTELDGAWPSLPGQKPPKQCVEECALPQPPVK